MGTRSQLLAVFELIKYFRQAREDVINMRFFHAHRLTRLRQKHDEAASQGAAR